MELSEIPKIVAWYFAWVPDGSTPFDPDTMRRNDEFVKSCQITQTQGDFAVATVKVRNRNRMPYSDPSKTWAWISCETSLNGVLTAQPWFLGYLEAWPATGDGREIQLRLVARPEDWAQRQEAVLEASRVLPFYDPAFIGSRDPVKQPEVTLEARPALVHCDRVTHEASLVSVIDAPDVLDIGALWNGRTLDLTRGENALDEVNFVLRCRYRQPVSVPFTFGIFGYTLTPSSIWQAIPRKGTQLESNYVVRDISFDIVLAEDAPGGVEIGIDEPASGHLGGVGLVDTDTERTKTRIARWSFGGSVTTQVTYEIQRQEEYRGSVRWTGQKTNRVAGPARSETIELEVSMQDASGFKRWKPNTDVQKYDLVQYAGFAYEALRDGTTSDNFAEDLAAVDQGGAEDPLWGRFDTASDLRYGSSYFTTPRGNQSIRHGILAAHARLAANRSEQGCGTSFQLLKPAMGLQVSCAMMMRVSMIPIGGDGIVVGKVASWSLEVDNVGARFRVQLASVPGTGEDPEENIPEPTEDEIIDVVYAPQDPMGIYSGSFPAQRPAWWPEERSWPPLASEDTLGAYTQSQNVRYANGRSDLYRVSAAVGFLPELATNPYEDGTVYPSQKPSWWPKAYYSPENFVDAFPWPPGTPVTYDENNGKTPNVFCSSDVFSFYKVPPENDFFDGSGGDRGDLFQMMARMSTLDDGMPYEAVPASDEPWDKVMVRQTVTPFIPSIPTDYLAPPRQGQDDQGNIITIPGGVEIKWSANDQEETLTNRNAPHWGDVISHNNRDPLNPGNATEPEPIPGDKGFDPQKALDKMETEIEIHLRDVSGLSSLAEFVADCYWNGPKHIDLGGS